jgi:hypothetical protein
VNPWLRGPVWDTALLSFVWVPYYAFIALARGDVLVEAALFHAAVTFVHRQYVFVMVYGDRERFAQRRAFAYAPLVFVPLLAMLVLAPGWAIWILLADRAWSVWHSVMQKYGIWRIYAAKAGGGLETRAHARRDRVFLLAQYAALLVILLQWRRSTLGFMPQIDRLVTAITPSVTSLAGRAVAVAILAFAIGSGAIWIRHELRARSLPRWSFLASILLLYVVTIVHGPVVGHLVFGTSHALEYIAFAHHFGEKKYGADGARRSLARALLQSVRRAPLVILGLGVLWWVTRRYDGVPAWMAIVYGTGAMHYLYDGWIWKVRQPTVARPLGLASSI